MLTSGNTVQIVIAASVCTSRCRASVLCDCQADVPQKPVNNQFPMPSFTILYIGCRRSDEEYLVMTEPVRRRNERHMAAAQQEHELAMQQWQRDYDLAVVEWQSFQVCSLICSAPDQHTFVMFTTVHHLQTCQLEGLFVLPFLLQSLCIGDVQASHSTEAENSFLILLRDFACAGTCGRHTKTATQ